MKQPEAFRDGQLGDVIKPYLAEDGKSFAKDFYMVNRLAAMVGASVDDYNKMNIMLGVGGFFGQPGDGRKPAHMFVVGPDDPDKLPNEVMTSPGTPVELGGPGWEPRGAYYRYDPEYDAGTNFMSWVLAGAPKDNYLGSWANGGLPLGYVQETWKLQGRDFNRPGWPGYHSQGRPGGRR